MWERFTNNPENFEKQKNPYQDEMLVREYKTAYETFAQKIDTLKPEVQDELFEIVPSQKKVDAYMHWPIEILQEFVDAFIFSPSGMQDASAILRVLQIKLENIDEG